jgi:malate dehydrogenase (oxaloacetate-decarboxylating)(NADP+)
VEEFFTAAQELYGRDVLLQFEDFGNSNAFRLLEKYRHRATCFNDDIQGTASDVVAGFYAALPLTPHKKLAEHRYLFFGAGEAGIGIADLLVSAIAKEKGHQGDLSELRKHCWFVDSKGLITDERLTNGGKIEHHKVPYAHSLEPGVTVGTSLMDAVKYVKPTAIIGVSAQGQVFTEQVIKQMLHYSKNPIIFSLSNPTSKAECTAEQAYTWTNGQAIFASGSPFDAVTISDGRKFEPGQGNNAYIFPGVGLGALVAKALSITDDDFLVAAETLASLVTPEQLHIGSVYPDLAQIRTVSKIIAAKVAENVFKTGRSTMSAKDEENIDWLQACEAAMYKPQY